MNRRKSLNALGIISAGLLSLSFKPKNSFVKILQKRWIASKEYTLEVVKYVPAEHLEFSPSDEQMTFAQHIIHLSFFNTLFLAFAQNEKGSDDFRTIMELPGIIKTPDDLNLFKNEKLSQRSSDENKEFVIDYSSDTFDYVINSLNSFNDDLLEKGLDKLTPEPFNGHTNLDMIQRGETHTAHHRAQAIGYMRMKGTKPPSFAKYNRLDI